ncbi:GNAT family N-acetyltransferase [Companilactobacillus sp. DQM5]|uniref:GNAT family N-acetyltransferase n=1 Tax=Companilactobacillus sp. DQM5 TaxID=3463359 RepID=UPI0040593BDC
MNFKKSQINDHQCMTDILLNAFADYPVFTAFLPEKTHRLDFLKELFTANIKVFEKIDGSYIAIDNNQIVGVLLVKKQGYKDPGILKYLMNSRANMYKPKNLKSLYDFLKVINDMDDEIISQEISWYVDSLTVNPNTQGKGVGSFLLEQLDKLVEKNGGKILLSTNKTINVSFYKKNNYQQINYSKSKYGFETWQFQKIIKRNNF